MIFASETDKNWNIGYVSGTFDMFHIGHLNLIRRARARCNKLIIGVLSDEAAHRGKKKWPMIPLKDRLAIIAALKYADEVDVTTIELLHKVRAWEKYRFDAMFSGDDHVNDGWRYEEKALKDLGADLVFFPYTKDVSSTALREKIVSKKVITYGTFDQFHVGHRRLLEHAKSLGSYLIVGVTADEYDVQRGKLNVVDSLTRRIDSVRSSGLADEIIVETHESQKIEDIQKNGVCVFVIGSDWRGMFDYLKEYCEVVYVERTKDVSSTELRIKRNGIVNLGVVGTGRIAARTMDELRYVSGVITRAVYNPRRESAETFAKAHELPHAFEDYDLMLEKVDAVYIASPHGTHYGYAKKALECGKHVLCEKPMVLKRSEAEELFSIAEKSGLVLMEAIKTAYAPGFLNLLSIAKSGRIGRIYDVEACFTKLVADNTGVREYDPVVGGSFTELGSYCLLPVIKLLGFGYKDIRFKSFKNENGVDIYTKAFFDYGGAVATVKTGIGVKSEGQLLVSGSNGYILVKSPWWLIKNFEVCYERRQNNESFSAPFPGYGMRFEIADFVSNINKPDMRNYKLSNEDSISMAGVMELFLNDRGVSV